MMLLPPVVLIVLSSLCLGNGSFFSVSPSYGDIAIYNNDVIISLAPNGEEDWNQVAFICADDLHDYDSVSKVISRQLGYLETACTASKISIAGWVPSSYTRAIRCNCKGTESHILRCCSVPDVYNYTMFYACSHKVIVMDPCQENKQLYRLGSRGNHAYNGQVLLFPPGINSSTFGISSPSIGLVAVKKEGKGCRDWRFVSKDSFAIDHTIASTFCRQMGYTDVVLGSITTRGEYEKKYPDNFDYWDFQITDPYLPLSSISCESVQTCLACCDYPHIKSCANTGTSPSSFDDILVIQCTYHLERNPAPSGNNKSCHFDDGKHAEVCEKRENMDRSAFIAVIVAPDSVFVVVIGILLVICVTLCIKCHCQNRCQRKQPNGRNDYQSIQGENNQGNNN